MNWKKRKKEKDDRCDLAPQKLFWYLRICLTEMASHCKISASGSPAQEMLQLICLKVTSLSCEI